MKKLILLHSKSHWRFWYGFASASGSVNQRYSSEDPHPDPYKNVKEHCFCSLAFYFQRAHSSTMFYKPLGILWVEGCRDWTQNFTETGRTANHCLLTINSEKRQIKSFKFFGFVAGERLKQIIYKLILSMFISGRLKMAPGESTTEQIVSTETEANDLDLQREKTMLSFWSWLNTCSISKKRGISARSGDKPWLCYEFLKALDGYKARFERKTTWLPIGTTFTKYNISYLYRYPQACVSSPFVSGGGGTLACGRDSDEGTDTVVL
jgi:hypothetical protein